jgi:hypothetical protein
MELTGKVVVIALSCAASLGCINDADRCDIGETTRCEERNGPIEVSYCERVGTWSDCTFAVECNPLTQEGCSEGLACYFDAAWTFCAPPDKYPCEPGEYVSAGVAGVGCHSHCALDGGDEMVPDAPECEESEWCYRVDILPEGVGLCGTVDEGI